MMKKLFFMITALLGTVTAAVADGSWTSGGCTVTLSGTTLTVTGTGAMVDYDNTEKRGWHKQIESIKSIVINEGVTSIGGGSFHSCSNLTEVIIPVSVTSIGAHAFNRCENLSSVTIPANVTSIGNYAFYYCSNLSSVTVYAANVPTLGTGAFNNNNANGRKFYVFETYVDAYKNNWTAYTNYIYKIPEGNLVVSGVTGNQNPGKTSDSWCSYYHPQANVKVTTNNVQPQIFKASLSGNELTLTPVEGNVIKAGQAVLLKMRTGDELSMELTSSPPTGDFSNNELKGTTTSITPVNAYVLNYKDGTGLGFYKLSSDGTIGPNKAYLTYEASAGTRQYFTFDEAAGIDDVSIQTDEAQGDYYDLLGRCVSQPRKGVYVVNGRKVVIK